MRGEYALTSWPTISPKGSPPHPWGILLTCCRGYEGLRITPTPVGNTPDGAQLAGGHKDHPHTSGEYFHLMCFHFGD